MGFYNYINNFLGTNSSNRFETEYSLLDKYITNPTKRANMLSNAELKRIYNSNKTAIKFFILELEKHFDVETIQSLIDATILRMPENVLVSFMTAYLNSSEVAKSNTDILSFYNKIQYFGPEAVKYVEFNGIITNRSYTELPVKIIEDKYQQVKTGSESYNGEMLDDIYNELSDQEKIFVYNLVEAKSFYLLERLFQGHNYSLKTVLHLLTANKIDHHIINEEVYDKLGFNLFVLVLLIIDSDYCDIVTQNVKYLISENRFTLLTKLIQEGLIKNIDKLSVTHIKELNDRQIYDAIVVSGRIYSIENTAA